MGEFFVFFTSVIGVLVGGTWAFGKTSLGGALIRQVATRETRDSADDEELGAWQDEVERLRDVNEELVDRLEMAERRLAASQQAREDEQERA